MMRGLMMRLAAAIKVASMHDVAVVGGGLTGVMMATALSHAEMDVALVDRDHDLATGVDERTTTINAAGARMLTALGVWDRLATPPAPIRRVAIAEGVPPTGLAARRRAQTDLSWQTNASPMGFVIGNTTLQAALRDIIEERPVTRIHGVSVSGWQAGDDGIELSLADINGTGDSSGASSLRAALVVACDGARSRLAEAAGLGLREARQTQTAIVTILEAERHHDDTAFQRFLPTGPFALMPLDGTRLSLVWTLPNAEADRLLAVDDAAFEAACLEAFGPGLGYLRHAGRRLAWPLRPSWRRRISAPGMVLAGDAAHAIHPLAGQGYNLALADAAVLADLLVETGRRGLPASHMSLRRAYEAARWRERAAMTTATSGLNSLFSNAPAGIRHLAGLGFAVLDRLPVKSVFSDIAAGGQLAEAALLEGRLPG
jgi:2-octaprenyl-6-methoxyphenol hydroxylase